jgi:hypothetical protein
LEAEPGFDPQQAVSIGPGRPWRLLPESEEGADSRRLTFLLPHFLQIGTSSEPVKRISAT